MKKLLIVVLGCVFLQVISTGNVFSSEGGQYKIDVTHSSIGFAVTHMEVGITRGVFTDYSGEVIFDKNNLDAFQAGIVINASSIDTRLEARDNHLRNEDFFHVEKYPTIIFKAKKLLNKAGGYEIVGDFTLRGVTREISVPVSIRGPLRSPFGGTVIGISGEVTINRQDYGVAWNDTMPGGGFVVGNEVKLVIDIEADHK
ncbi:YceI family protein [Candidatus Omnitrophota bacterium]